MKVSFNKKSGFIIPGISNGETPTGYKNYHGIFVGLLSLSGIGIYLCFRRNHLKIKNVFSILICLVMVGMLISSMTTQILASEKQENITIDKVIKVNEENVKIQSFVKYQKNIINEKTMFLKGLNLKIM